MNSTGVSSMMVKNAFDTKVAVNTKLMNTGSENNSPYCCLSMPSGMPPRSACGWVSPPARQAHSKRPSAYIAANPKV